MSGMRQRLRAGLSGQAILTGRKEAITLPESRAGKSTWVGKLGRGCQERLMSVFPPV